MAELTGNALLESQQRTLDAWRKQLADSGALTGAHVIPPSIVNPKLITQSFPCKHRGGEAQRVLQSCLRCNKKYYGYSCINPTILDKPRAKATDGAVAVIEVNQCHENLVAEAMHFLCSKCEEREPFSLKGNPSWSIAITTAPRREVTIQRSLESLKRAGWVDSEVNIFAEPESNLDGVAKGIQVRHNLECLQAWKNFLQACEYLANQDVDLAMYCQDDVVYALKSKQFIEKEWPEGAEILSPYCAAQYTNKIPSTYEGFITHYREVSLQGALCLIAPPYIWRMMLDHSFIQGFKYVSGDGKEAGIDKAFGHWSWRVRRPIYIMVPSLCQHIGHSSAIWEDRKVENDRIVYVNRSGASRSSGTFRGELYIATKLDKETRIFDSTVIIPCYKRTHYLQEQVNNIRESSRIPKKILLLVQGTENTITRSVMDDVHNVQADSIITCCPNSYLHFRWAIALQCDTEFVCMIDDDTVPGLKWFENCIDCFIAQPGIYGGMGSRVIDIDSYRREFCGVYGQKYELCEVDYVGQSWFLKREYVPYLFMEDKVTKDTDDIELALRAKRYAGIKTYVPPHSESLDMNSSLYPNRGRDSHAVYKNKDFKDNRIKALQYEYSKGWRPLCMAQEQ